MKCDFVAGHRDRPTNQSRIWQWPGRKVKMYKLPLLKTWSNFGPRRARCSRLCDLGCLCNSYHLLTSFELVWDGWKASLALRIERETKRTTRTNKRRLKTRKQTGNSGNPLAVGGQWYGRKWATQRGCRQIETAPCLRLLPPRYCAIISDSHRCPCGASSLQLQSEESFVFLWLFSARTGKTAYG